MIKSCFFSLIIFHFLFSHGNAVSFSITHFSPGANNIIYEGDAVPSGGGIELINLVDYTCRVGHAIYAEQVPLWDPSTGKLADFSTRFSFTIDTLNSKTYGHGIAFFLASVGYQIPPNSAGGFLGLVNNSASSAMSQTQLVVVEFDTFVNNGWDPPTQHVGINNNSISSAVYASWDAGSYSGKTVNVLVTHNATSKNLTVLWKYEKDPDFLSNSSLSYHIDLMQVLPPSVIIGFSAATGEYTERNTINSWDFTSNLDPIKRNKKKLVLSTFWKICIGVVSGFFGCFIIDAAVWWVFGCMIIEVAVMWSRKNKITRNNMRKSTTSAHTANTGLGKGALPRRFRYEELATATNDFADDMKLGEGGTGLVYKGALTDRGCLVAVKKVAAQSESLFINEVNIISSLRHRHLLQFMGYCHEEGNFLLVYEYMPNGSLSDHLFGNRRTFAWNLRYNTALAIASALKYLHEDTDPYVLHRDIKPENILLRDDFTAKVGDFGIAKLVDTQFKTERTYPVGTHGYLAPEYQKKGKASKESDMYSFGIVALEIASGRRNRMIGEKSQLVKEVWTVYKADTIVEAADNSLNREFDENEMECLMIVGLWCTHPNDEERPSARRVIQYLNFEAPLPKLPSMLHDPVFPNNSDVDRRNTR